MTPEDPNAGAPKAASDLSANPFRALAFRDWLFIPHLLGRRERAMFGFFLALALISGSTAASLILFKLTRESPRRGGIYREGVIKAPERINPLFLSNNDTDRDIAALVFAPLFYYDAAGDLKPEIAESFVVSEDGKSYIVKLRENVRWHDETPLTADDVVYTVKTVQDPAYKSSLRPNWQGVTIERLGDYEVRFVLKQAYSPFLQNLALPIIPRHIWSKIPAEAASLANANLKPIGSGPYRFESLEKNDQGVITRYRLAAVSDYFLPGPYLEEIEFKLYETEEQMIRAYQAEDIDGISIVSAKNVQRLQNVGANVWNIRIPRIFAIFMNEAHEALKDKAVRVALAESIPKDELVEKALGGGAVVANSPIPPGTYGYNANLPALELDLEKASSTFAKAGWVDLNGDGLREKKPAKKGQNPTPLKITLTTSDWGDLVKTAELIKGYWRAIGVEAEITTLPVNELENTVIRPRAYDALLFGEILGRDPDLFAFWHSSQLKDPGLNIALYHSKKVDTLLEEARRLTDRGEIKERYVSFQNAVLEDFPAIFLYSPTYYYASRKNVQGINLQSLVLPSERFTEARLWYKKTKRVF